MGMSRVFWDTNLFIYLFESREPFSTQVETLRSRPLSATTGRHSAGVCGSGGCGPLHHQRCTLAIQTGSRHSIHCAIGTRPNLEPIGTQRPEEVCKNRES